MRSDDVVIRMMTIMIIITLSFAPTAKAMSTRMRKDRRVPPPPVYIPTPTF